MNTRSILFLSVLAIIAVAFSITAPVDASTFSTANDAQPLPVNETGIKEMVYAAAATYAVGITANVQLPTSPTGATCVWITAVDAAINLGPSTVSGTAGGGVPVATGTTVKLNLRQDTARPTIYMAFTGNTSATGSVRLTYGR